MEIPIATALDSPVPTKRLTHWSPTRSTSFADVAHRLLLTQFAPPAALINPKFEVLHLFGNTDGYLIVPSSEPTRDLLMMARACEKGKFI